MSDPCGATLKRGPEEGPEEVESRGPGVIVADSDQSLKTGWGRRAGGPQVLQKVWMFRVPPMATRTLNPKALYIYIYISLYIYIYATIYIYTTYIYTYIYTCIA